MSDSTTLRPRRHRPWLAVCPGIFVLAAACIFTAARYPLEMQAAVVPKPVQPPATPAPKITGLSGLNEWDWDKAPKWRHYKMVDFFEKTVSGSPIDPALVITGSDFGSNANGNGIVKLSGTQFSVRSIVSWTDKVIKVRLKSELEAIPSTVTVTVVRRSDGKNSDASSGSANRINLIPTVHTRSYGQCTWYTSYRRAKVGRAVPNPSAYSHNIDINENYVPQPFDVLMWSGHQGLVESVRKTTTPGKAGVVTTTYAVTIYQYNADVNMSESLGQYTTTVTIEDIPGTKATKPVRRMTGKYQFSSKSGGATTGWR